LVISKHPREFELEVASGTSRPVCEAPIP
jgi:hypothetical protein